MSGWLVLSLILAVVWVLAEQIGQAFDWALDRMGWGSQTHGPASKADHEWCPCSVDRSFHSRITETKDLS